MLQHKCRTQIINFLKRVQFDFIFMNISYIPCVHLNVKREFFCYIIYVLNYFFCGWYGDQTLNSCTITNVSKFKLFLNTNFPYLILVTFDIYRACVCFSDMLV